MLLTIEPYQNEYAEALRLVYQRARQVAFPWVDPRTFQPLDFDDVIQDETVLVAIQQMVPVGFIAWWPPDNFIHSLFVDPSFTKKGIGRSLLQACLQQMERPATLKCKVANQQALHFYYSLGWIPIKEAESQHGTYLLLAYNQ